MSAKKIILIVVAVLVLAGVVVGTIIHGQSSVTKVATGKAVRQDLTSIVNGTGQIKPKTYVNIGATAFGRITHLYVKEGDHVKAGTTLATVESVQPQATVAAQQATIAAANTDISSFLAAEKTAEANIAQAKADLEQKKLDFNRAQSLYNDKLIAKQDFDAKKAAYDMSLATLDQRQAALAQSRAQTASQRGHMNQAVASQRANYDALDKTISRAPFDGLVTNVPVREGETVVLGIQNAEGSTLMTLADMSVITAEVKVDETDIVNVRLNQPVDVTVDALPGRV
jgi:HlyD family secretion protein